MSCKISDDIKIGDDVMICKSCKISHDVMILQCFFVGTAVSVLLIRTLRIERNRYQINTI